METTDSVKQEIRPNSNKTEAINRWLGKFHTFVKRFPNFSRFFLGNLLLLALVWLFFGWNEYVFMLALLSGISFKVYIYIASLRAFKERDTLSTAVAVIPFWASVVFWLPVFFFAALYSEATDPGIEAGDWWAVSQFQYRPACGKLLDAPGEICANFDHPRYGVWLNGIEDEYAESITVDGNKFIITESNLPLLKALAISKNKARVELSSGRIVHLSTKGSYKALRYHGVVD